MGDNNERFLKINVISIYKYIFILFVLEFVYFVKFNIIIDIFRLVKLFKIYVGLWRLIVIIFNI